MAKAALIAVFAALLASGCVTTQPSQSKTDGWVYAPPRAATGRGVIGVQTLTGDAALTLGCENKGAQCVWVLSTKTPCVPAQSYDIVVSSDSTIGDKSTVSCLLVDDVHMLIFSDQQQVFYHVLGAKHLQVTWKQAEGVIKTAKFNVDGYAEAYRKLLENREQ